MQSATTAARFAPSAHSGSQSEGSKSIPAGPLAVLTWPRPWISAGLGVPSREENEPWVNPVGSHASASPRDAVVSAGAPIALASDDERASGQSTPGDRSGRRASISKPRRPAPARHELQSYSPLRRDARFGSALRKPPLLSSLSANPCSSAASVRCVCPCSMPLVGVARPRRCRATPPVARSATRASSTPRTRRPWRGLDRLQSLHALPVAASRSAGLSRSAARTR
jgi:hypothetical protein